MVPGAVRWQLVHGGTQLLPQLVQLVMPELIIIIEVGDQLPPMMTERDAGAGFMLGFVVTEIGADQLTGLDQILVGKIGVHSHLRDGLRALHKDEHKTGQYHGKWFHMNHSYSRS